VFPYGRGEVTGYADLYEQYRAGGLAERIGFGERPALLVVDLMRGFTDSAFPLGAEMGAVVSSAGRLMAAARSAAVPVVVVRSAYRPDGKDAAHWLRKMPGALGLVEGSAWVEFDPRLEVTPGDTVITKKFASAFFGTSLASFLVTQGVDTVLVAGCTTSGCVRATALDSHQHGFKTIIPREAVGDRAEEPHWASLFDLDTKYADVVPLAEAETYVESLAQATGASSSEMGRGPSGN